MVPLPDTSGKKCKVEGTKDDNEILIYNMTKQEQRLQHEEEKYGISMSTFGYKEDDSDLGSDMDMD